VSAYPQEVTGQMLHNFVSGGAAISVLARQLDAVGSGRPRHRDAGLNLPGVRHLNIGAGTANFAKGRR
jgi:nicotinate-nucleotide--dimethylbenzimidazole phosphoribosyltransferase